MNIQKSNIVRSKNSFLRHKKFIVGILKIILGCGLLWWLIWSGWLDMKIYSSIRFGWVLLSLVACQVLMVFVPMIRWYYLAHALRLHLSLWHAIYIGCAGSFANIFLPTGIGVDGMRLAYGIKINPHRKTDIVSSIIMDRVLGMAALALIGLFAAGLLCIHFYDTVFAQWSYLLAALLALFGLILMVLFSRRASGWLKKMVPWQRAHRLADSFRQYRYCKRTLLGSFFLSLLTHISSILAAWLGFLLLGSRVRLLAVFAFTPLINLSGMLPVTPVGLGVTDSVAEGLYQVLDLTQGAEVNMLLRCVTILISLAAGSVLLRPFGGYRGIDGKGD